MRWAAVPVSICLSRGTMYPGHLLGETATVCKRKLELAETVFTKASNVLKEARKNYRKARALSEGQVAIQEIT